MKSKFQIQSLRGHCLNIKNSYSKKKIIYTQKRELEKSVANKGVESYLQDVVKEVELVNIRHTI